MGRLLGIAACAAIAALAGPPAAHATVIDLTDYVLSVSDPTGEDNVLDLRPIGFGTYEAYDGRAPLVGTGGCANATPQLVRCFGFALEIDVNTGAGDDLVGLWDDFRAPVRLNGGAGDDALAGGPGNDELEGADGDDSLTGGTGLDRAAGQAGFDHLSGGEAADTLLGGDGPDIIEGGAGAGDVLLGRSGPDLLLGGRGADQLQGGDGDDALAGGKGSDTVGTGTGADEVFSDQAGRDQVDCRADDVISGDARLSEPACHTSVELSFPEVWPPPEAADTGAKTAAIVINVQGEVVRQSAARRFWVWAGSVRGTSYPVDVVAVVRGAGRRLYTHCFHRLWTNHKITRPLPSRARSATAVTGRVLRGRTCP